MVARLVAQLRFEPEPVTPSVGVQLAALAKPEAARVVRVEPHAPARTVAEQLAALATDQ